MQPLMRGKVNRIKITALQRNSLPVKGRIPWIKKLEKKLKSQRYQKQDKEGRGGGWVLKRTGGVTIDPTSDMRYEEGKRITYRSTP